MAGLKDIFIEAKAVSYNYPGEETESSPALSGIDMVIKKGEYVALIGPNGSGKTTLMKLFNALLIPSSGEVLVEGISTADEEKLPEIRRRCGMIFQNPDNQLVATTVEEDIAFGPENLALPTEEIRERVYSAARQLGLDRVLKQPPHMLSGGEKQRVAIAGVLAMQPGCILMDEPTAMLDAAGRREVLKTVAALNRDHGIAIVHVTHFPTEAALADRIVLLDHGSIVTQGSPQEILTDLSLLHNLGLRGTIAVELAAALRRDGLQLKPMLLHNRELIESLCSLERKI